MDYVIKLKGKENITILLWIGLLVYSIGLQLVFTFNDSLIFRLLYVVGVLFVIIPSFAYINIRSFFNKGVIYCMLLLWCCFMYIRSGYENYFSLYNYGTISYFALVMPSLAILPFIKSMIKVSVFVNVFFIITFWIPILMSGDTGFIQSYLESYATFAAFIFLTNKYHSKKDIYLSFTVLALAFFVAAITARRNLMLTFGLYMLLGSIFFIFNGKLKSVEVKIMSLFASLLLLSAVYYFYMSERTGTFSKITSRATENTREEVFLAFAVDMFNVKDLTLGRGMYGSYYNPGVDLDPITGESYDERGNIECGYLQLILKGGIVYLFLYSTLFIVAIFKGLKAKNQFSKGSAIILIIQLIDMFPFGIHDFNTKTFVIWTALAVCLNRTLCNMNDEEIKSQIYNRKNKLFEWQRK